MTRWVLCIAILFFAATSAHAETDYGALSNAQLIDQLATLDKPVVGADGLGLYDGFIAAPETLGMSMGIVGAPRPAVPPQMVELVRRGVRALPDLLAHLTDARPTGIVVGNASKKFEDMNYMWQVFANEYRDKVPVGRSPVERSFAGPYTVKVGDLCFSLVGQIVGRWLTAVRYQATAGLVINSPLETPELARLARRDWRGTTVAGFRRYLLAEVMTDLSLRYEAALMRLRFYFPTDYAALSGAAAERRDVFETRLKAKLGQ